MKITLLVLGRTEEDYLKDGINKYLKRLKHYTDFSIFELPSPRGAKYGSEEQQKLAEADLVLKNIDGSAYLVLLDEGGKDLTSTGFSKFLEQKVAGNIRHLVFLVGGPYGFHKQLIEIAKETLSLSKMTFSHQMVRLFFVEQLYRAFSIMKNEPYHHQ